MSNLGEFKPVFGLQSFDPSRFNTNGIEDLQLGQISRITIIEEDGKIAIAKVNFDGGAEVECELAILRDGTQVPFTVFKVTRPLKMWASSITGQSN